MYTYAVEFGVADLWKKNHSNTYTYSSLMEWRRCMHQKDGAMTVEGKALEAVHIHMQPDTNKLDCGMILSDVWQPFMKN